MKLYAMTDVGRKRGSNQDAFCSVQISDEIGFLILCDGMGGHKGGNVASELAVRGFSRQLRAGLDPALRPKDLKNLLYAAAQKVNVMILNAASRNEQLSGMGTTAVIAARCGKKLCVMHVGDSRAYLFRDGTLTRLTKDHSLVQLMQDMGEITPEEAENHPYRHVITRVLGTGSDYEPEILVEDVRPGDVILLCSDGLTNVVKDDVLTECIATCSPRELPSLLVEKALAGGGPDNVTVGILQEESEANHS